MAEYLQEIRGRDIAEVPNHMRMARFLIDMGLFEESLNGEWPRLPQPACKEVIKNLPDIVIESEGKECSICLIDFKKKEIVKQMPCHHVFHAPCLLTWLSQNNTCPFCRHKLPTA